MTAPSEAENTPPPPTNGLPDGWVYFIRGGDFIKIGWSQDPDRRRNDLSTGSPFKLEVIGKVPGSGEDEQSFHRAFSHLRTNGEWFEASPELLAFIGWAIRYADKQGTAGVATGQGLRAVRESIPAQAGGRLAALLAGSEIREARWHISDGRAEEAVAALDRGLWRLGLPKELP